MEEAYVDLEGFEVLGPVGIWDFAKWWQGEGQGKQDWTYDMSKHKDLILVES